MKTIRKTKLLLDNITVYESVIKEKDRHFYNIEVRKGREILSINERPITEKEYKKLTGDEDEKIKPYKPLPKDSKFAKANAYGQIPKDCISFNWCGKHCKGTKDCQILKGEYCKEYRC